MKTNKNKNIPTWLLIIIFIIVVFAINDSDDKTEVKEKETLLKQQEQKIEQEEVKKRVLVYDDLQKIYLAINPNMNYEEVLRIVKDSGLPYSEQTVNGSNAIKVAFKEGVRLY